MKNKPEYGDSLWGNNESNFDAHCVTAALSPEKIEMAKRFYSDGFIKFDSIVSTELCDLAFSDYLDWVNRNSDSIPQTTHGRTPRVVNLHADLDSLKKLLTKSPALLDKIDSLFGYRTSIYTSLTFKYGTEQPLHIDTPVFRTAPEEFYFGVWIALEDSNEENGCLQALKGAHKTERTCPYEFVTKNQLNPKEISPSAAKVWTPYQNEFVQKCISAGHEPISIPAKKGDVVIWHPQLPHGGTAIKNPNRSRASIVYHCVPEGVPVYQADVFFDQDRRYETTTSARIYDDFEDRKFMRTRAAFGQN